MNPSRKDMLQRPDSTLNIFGFGLDFGALHRYPVPWGGRGGEASWVQGLPWGNDTIH
jgi:hypothetical protein